MQSKSELNESFWSKAAYLAQMATGRKPLAEVLLKLRNFCGYQERCHSDVRSKLLKMHVYGEDLEEIIADLVREGFLNEERYARSFARGKFRMNHWGRTKIRMHLKHKQVADFCIQKGLSEIDAEEYAEYVNDQVVQKLGGKTDFAARQKAAGALIRKGFESELVWQCVNDHTGNF